MVILPENGAAHTALCFKPLIRLLILRAKPEGNQALRAWRYLALQA